MRKSRLFPRLMAVFLLAVILIGMLPAGVLAVDVEGSPPTVGDTTVTEPPETTPPETTFPESTPSETAPPETTSSEDAETLPTEPDLTPTDETTAPTTPSEAEQENSEENTSAAAEEPERELTHGWLGDYARNMGSMSFYNTQVTANQRWTYWHYLDNDNNESNNGYSSSSPFMQTLYCVQPSLPFSENVSDTSGYSYRDLLLTDEREVGSSYKETALKVWSRMGYDVRRAIALTMFYGCPNELWDEEAGLREEGGPTLYNNDNPNIGYRYATQVVIREFLDGTRSPVYPYELLRESKWTKYMTGHCMSADGTIDYTVYGYNYIIERMKAHEEKTVLPSFTAATAGAAPEYEVKDNRITLEDTNGVLFHFTITGAEGVTITREGNNLTITTTDEFTEATISGYWLKPDPEKSTYIAIGYNPERQTTVGIVKKEYTKVYCYFKLKAEPKTGTVQLAKAIDASAECIDQIRNNPLYSLAGAEYGVYLDGELQEILVTDANGNAASSVEYEVGTTLIIKEITAPPGFVLDTAAYEITVAVGINTVTVKDKPVFDPPFALTKVDSSTENPQGDSSFSGAVFRWEYFPNYDWSGMPERTWYFHTNTSGVVRYASSFLSPDYTSDALFMTDTGANEIPLGSIKITELKNSLGYSVISSPLFCSITQETSGFDYASVTWTLESLMLLTNIAAGNYGVLEPQDTETFGGFTLSKKDSITGDTPQGSAALAGARFQVINSSANSVKIGDFPEAAPGEVCFEFTVGADGKYDTGSIFPIGCYSIKEVEAPVGYELNSTWSQGFIVSSGEHYDFTCENTVFKGGLKLIKYDMDFGAETGSDALLDGITFSLINNNENPVSVNGVSYAKGETVMILAIKWDGNAWTAATGADILPYGKYIIQENPMTAGSSMANEDFYLNTNPQEIEIDQDGKIITVQFENKFKVIPGKVTIYKTDLIGRPLAGAKLLFEWSEDGEHWHPVEYSDQKRPYKGSCGTKGLKDGCLTTGSDGVVIFENLYVGLYYRVTELEAPDGYILLTDFAYEGKLTKTEPDVEISIMMYGKCSKGETSHGKI